jgi:broad specificity phosphatase PhoE
MRVSLTIRPGTERYKAYRQGGESRRLEGDHARCPYRDMELCEAWEAGYEDFRRYKPRYSVSDTWTGHLHRGESLADFHQRYDPLWREHRRLP